MKTPIETTRDYTKKGRIWVDGQLTL